MEFEKVAPDAGEPGAKPADQTTINHITTIIYGHDNTVAVQGSAVGQHVTVQAGDLDSLTKALSQLGLRTEDVAELKHAIQDDEADEDTPKGQPGGRVKKFLGKVALGGVAAAGKDAVKEGMAMVGELVRHYYGIGG